MAAVDDVERTVEWNLGQANLIEKKKKTKIKNIYRWVVGLLGGRPAPEWDEVGVTGESIDWRPP